MHLSFIIPAYNESRRIGDTLVKAHDYFSRQNYDWEMIVVDDGSSDGTAGFVRRSFPGVRVIDYTPNQGKGHAVRAGMLAARGEYRFFSDADGSTPVEEIEKLRARFSDGADVVIGSRTLPDADVQVRQAWHRQTMGRVFNVFVQLLAVKGFPDTQCGFKGFSRAAAADIFPRMTIKGFGFDAEVLFIARKHGFRIDQVGVVWLNSPASSVHAVSDSARMLRDLVRIRLRDLRRLYD
ncbi:MAG TPA: glycosyltransferase family 2 protein [Candidatus Hydrogenedentes bacterium]|nr:glycosyltransferase family 2 protein [Candidatus Hydrogenedentota bacterium]HPK00165.1 glycosyltransferase family 2 protein [Candidatus Hydrogenedentota bacterium]